MNEYKKPTTKRGLHRKRHIRRGEDLIEYSRRICAKYKYHKPRTIEVKS